MAYVRKKFSASICCMLAMFMLLLAAMSNIGGGNVTAKYAATLSLANKLVVPMNGFTVSYYNQDGTTLYKTYSVMEKHTVPACSEISSTLTNEQFDYWEYAGGKQVYPGDVIEAEATLYAVMKDLTEYTVRYLGNNGEIIGTASFTADDVTKGKTGSSVATPTAPAIKNFEFEKWVVKKEDGSVDDWNSYKLTKSNIAVYAQYLYAGAASLIPVDSDGDGDADYFQVGGYSNGQGSYLVEIPAEVNGVPVTTINSNAFSSYPDLHSVRIPANVNSIGEQSFADYEGWLRKRQTVTIYYEGTQEQWAAYMAEYKNGNYQHLANKWDDAMGNGSRVFFLGENGMVDLTQGYWQYDESGFINKTFTWNYYDTISQDIISVYSGTCDCDSCKGDLRPDHDYWVAKE